MRLSCLVIATSLIMSTMVLAQHTSGGSGSGGGSSSHGASSGGSFSASHSSGGFGSSGSSAPIAAPVSKSSSSIAIKSPYVKQDAQAGKASGHSFFHPMRKAQPAEKTGFIRPQTCWRKPCGVCPSGQSRNGRGACVPVSETCLANPLSLGLYCSTSDWWANQCGALANELAAEHQRLHGRHYLGDSVQYQRLKEQYEECLQRMGYMYGLADYALYGGVLEVP